MLKLPAPALLGPSSNESLTVSRHLMKWGMQMSVESGLTHVNLVEPDPVSICTILNDIES